MLVTHLQLLQRALKVKSAPGMFAQWVHVLTLLRLHQERRVEEGPRESWEEARRSSRKPREPRGI